MNAAAQLAARTTEQVREGWAGRLGGDEFAVVLGDLGRPERAYEVAAEAYEHQTAAV